MAADALFALPLQESPVATVDGEDVELDRVAEWFRAQRDLSGRFGAAIRRALDEVIDGGRTGRWHVSQLRKTEQTYIGTKLEILVAEEFALPFARAGEMDYVVAGAPVDCKWSRYRSGWQIPTEAMGQICLLLWGDDDLATFSVGLVRIDGTLLNGGENKDRKRTLSVAGRAAIRWLMQDDMLPANFLLQLNPDVRAAVLTPRSGQARVTELFRHVQDRIVPRQAIVTLATQDDPMKRVRDARKALVVEGITVLGGYRKDRLIAASLGLPEPRKGESLATMRAVSP